MFSELIKKSRTRRIYDGSEVTFSQSKEVIEDCRYSASTINRQDIRYILINDDKICSDIFNITNLPSTHKVDIKNKPGAFIVMIVEKELHLPDQFLYYNIGIATSNIILSANSNDLSCVTLLSTNMTKLSKLINLDDDKKVVSVIGIGKSSQKVETTDIGDGDTAYYKNNENIHVVPKLTAEALIIQEI